MSKFSISLLVLTLGLGLMPQARAQADVRQQLLEQIRLGETTQRDDLVRQSLYRLELMDPDNPQTISARLRYQLRQGDMAGAQRQLDRLATLAPGSDALRQAQLTMTLASQEGRQQLQQARLLGATGHVPQALAAYQKLFNGKPPQGELAVEYWTLAAKLPAQRNEALSQLQAINRQEPGNVQASSTLAQLFFASDRDEEGFAVLEQLAKSATGRETASRQWYQHIQSMPISDASVKALQRYLSVFSFGDSVAKAQTQLAEQQAKLADPAFRARAQGLAAVDAGQGGGALPELEQARRANPQDSEVLGALAQAYARQGNRAKAVSLLEQAMAIDPASDNRSKWDSLLQTNRYWLLIGQGDAALKANDIALAKRKYQQARAVDKRDSYAVLGLGDVAVAEKDDAAAERYYQQALRLDRGNSNAVRGLANLYRRQSPVQASTFIAGLSASQRRSIDDIERSLTNDRLEQEAAALENQGRFSEAAARHRERLALSPGDVWITYRLAKDLAAAGQQTAADTAFADLARLKPQDAEQVYARSLYLSGQDRDQEALAQIAALPQAKWNPNIRELAQRLASNGLINQANRLRDAGQERQAITLLLSQPPATRIDLTLADWAQQRGDDADARALYQKVLQREPDNADARLGLAEVLADEGDGAGARAQLAQLPVASPGEPPALNAERRVANVLALAGDKTAAREGFRKLIPQATSQPPSQATALVLRDAARFQAQDGEPQQALETYRDAMVASGIAPSRPRDNGDFTRLTRNHEKDDWLKRGVRSDAAALYRQQDVNVTLDHDYWGSSGTPGYSDLKAHTTMLQVDAPLSDGRMFFRTDVVNMNAGSFKSEDGVYSPSWGTCEATPCYGSASQKAHGVSVAAGWRNDTWEGDIGTTPMGFKVVDIVGGLSYSDDLGPVGYTLNAHRRPLSSSLLAFAGQKDASANTGTTWGGVRATGGGVSLSYDKGEANGVWASLNADMLTGKNVQDNWRVRWMTGYYYKFINEDNRRLTLGLNNMIWHYEKDLSGYNLGQGGYYSPQEYVSFAVPLTWRQRTENWSWEVGGSASWSHSRTRSGPRYPLSGLVPSPQDTDGDGVFDRYGDKAEPESGGTGSGFGYTARALVERRISKNWSIGAGIDIQQAKDYTPSHAQIFVRYSQAGWQGDMDMPPQPLVPYADW